MIGLAEARDLVRRHIHALPAEQVPLEDASLRYLAENTRARVDCPTDDVSLKDGFAVIAGDTASAAQGNLVSMRLAGSRFAGRLEEKDLRVSPGRAVRVTSGAVLPGGTDAVVGCEYCELADEEIRLRDPVPAGKNILPRGTDIRTGVDVGKVGDLLTPGRIGWMAASGGDCVQVHRRPHVALVATGDEVVAPGRPLQPGQLYASNLATLAAWLHAFGIPSSNRVLPDRHDVLSRELPALLETADTVLTSGGAWGSDRDLVIGVLRELGWREMFHRVRLGPGKAVAFGFLQDKPVFCLPGGPPSNEKAFLQLALPGVLQMAGRGVDPFPLLEARLTKPLLGREMDWTQIKRGKIEQDREGLLRVTPCKPASRLESIALTDCLIIIPEGVERLEAGDKVSVQVLLFSEGSVGCDETS